MLIDIYKAIALAPEAAAKAAEHDPEWYEAVVKGSVRANKRYDTETEHMMYYTAETYPLVSQSDVDRMKKDPSRVFAYVFGHSI